MAKLKLIIIAVVVVSSGEHFGNVIFYKGKFTKKQAIGRFKVPSIVKRFIFGTQSKTYSIISSEYR